MNGFKKLIATLPKICVDSFKVAFAILGGVEIILSFTDFSLDGIGKLPAQIGVVVLAYIILVLGTVFIKHRQTKSEVKLDIRGMTVVVREGDIFQTNGWRVIPFNEYFDTKVDDVVIAHATLNGKYIDALNDVDKSALIEAINTDNSSPFEKTNENGKAKYELGTVKIFQETMMLALTHFNEQNEAHTNRAEYEHTLRKMWREIRRTYQGKSVNIPLIGGGITQLDDMTEKPKEQLLKCILCTLRTSSITLDAPITIVLDKKTMESINLYELKGEQ